MINTVKFTKYNEDSVGMAISKFIYEDDITALHDKLPQAYSRINSDIEHMQQWANHYIDYLLDTTVKKSELEKNIKNYI